MSKIAIRDSEKMATAEATTREVKIKEASRNTVVSKETSTSNTSTEVTVEEAPEAVVVNETDENAAEEAGEGTDAVVVEDSEVLGEAATDDAVITDETVSEEIVMEEGFIDEGMTVEPVFNDGMMIDPGFEGGMYPGMETGMVEVKDPLLSSWPFVIGISAAVLFVSVAFGVLLARRKIKKGIELYED